MSRPLLLVLMFLWPVIGYGSDLDDPKRSDQAEKESARLREQIQHEIQTLGDHPWAGKYYEGDGRGVNVSLLLAPESGHLFEWHGCLGLYDRNYGAVTLGQGKLRLSFTFPNDREGFQRLAEEFVPVPWGARMYLIPTDDVVGFCNEVNAGSEPRNGRHGFYLLRCGDEQKAVSGFPEVPPEFKPYLLARPIEATISAVKRSTRRPSVATWKFIDTPVVLNTGKTSGLLPGMKMHVIWPSSSVLSATITKVEEHSSEAVVTRVGQEQGPRKGWRLSTRTRSRIMRPTNGSARD